MNTRVKQRIIELAQATPEAEVCGLIYQTLDGAHVYPSTNVTREEEGPSETFEVDPQAYAEAASLGRVIGVYHSHGATGSVAFSEADLDVARALELPLYLYANRDGSWHSYIPPAYQIPLTGTSWCWGFADCLETVRTYCRQVRGIHIRDYDRDETFENADTSIITDHIRDEGFIVAPGTSQLKEHDILVFRTPGRAYPQHLGVFVGHQKVLHHPLRGLSRMEPLNGAWLKRVSMVLRYAGTPSVSSS